MKQNPYSLYDFLGYFTPGATLIYGSAVVWWQFVDDGAGLHQLLDTLADLGSVEAFLPFLLLAYLTGHALSFVSSVTVERYAVWTQGYPSSYLLGNEPKRGCNISHVLLCLLLLPVPLLDWLIGKRLHARRLYAKQLDSSLAATVKLYIENFVHRKCHARLRSTHPVEEADYFRAIYHYTIENATAHVGKLQNYVALYGFSRTTTLIAVVFFWTFLVLAVTMCDDWKLLTALALVCAALAYVFYMEFSKFYRKFTLEVFMALVAIDEIPAQS